eukprot:6198403-Pleurochrysis_carterae.AAC.2
MRVLAAAVYSSPVLLIDRRHNIYMSAASMASSDDQLALMEKQARSCHSSRARLSVTCHHVHNATSIAWPLLRSVDPTFCVCARSQLKHLMVLTRGEIRESKGWRSSPSQREVPEASRLRRQQLLLARGSQGSSGRASSRTGGTPTPTASREPSMNSEVSEGSCSNLGLLSTSSVCDSRVSSVEDLQSVVPANTDK